MGAFYRKIPADDRGSPEHYAASEDSGHLRVMRDGLKRARASGIRSVAYGDGRVEYASDREMAAALAAIESDIARLEGGARSTFIRINATKGV